jgi:hypothetical protein
MVRRRLCSGLSAIRLLDVPTVVRQRGDMLEPTAVGLEELEELEELIWGGRRVSNPRPPEPQSGVLPLNYAHDKVARTTATKILISLLAGPVIYAHVKKLVNDNQRHRAASPTARGRGDELLDSVRI